MPRWLRVTRRAAPHVKVTGPLVSLVDRKKLELDVPPIIKVSSPDEARAIIARELPSRPDYIKVWFIHQKDGNLPAEEEIVRAAADAVHAAGLRLIVHATELVTAKAALRAGADVLVHSVMDAPGRTDTFGEFKIDKLEPNRQGYRLEATASSGGFSIEFGLGDESRYLGVVTLAAA